MVILFHQLWYWNNHQVIYHFLRISSTIYIFIIELDRADTAKLAFTVLAMLLIPPTASHPILDSRAGASGPCVRLLVEMDIW